jgi:hypothetical protein
MGEDLKTDEFYIGYDPPMPPRLSRFVTRVTLGLGGGILAWSAIAASGHIPLEGGTFEFGHPTQLTGVVVEHPYPALRLEGGPEAGTLASLLVAPGKHGASGLVRGLDGQRVTVNGTRVYRGDRHMLELDGVAVTASTSAPAAAAKTVPAAGSEVVLTGEIVDSKCFLGVMVPGEGTTHKDCASLCIRGGIPPALHVRDTDGHSALILLTDKTGAAVNDAAFKHAGRGIEMTGTLSRQDDWLVLKTESATWRLADR